MQKDFKTGMALGLALVTIVVVLLSTRPSLSIKARMLSPHSAVHRKMGIPPLSHSIEPRKETTISGNPAKQANNEQLKETKAERFHIVRAGETLSDISYKYYGSADKWQKILGADHLPIENPSKLRPGTRLIIPE
ncbi:MAG: LysM peptidoglycan-binding domain-containing protein [Sedimentisphaerales bacterium]